MMRGKDAFGNHMVDATQMKWAVFLRRGRKRFPNRQIPAATQKKRPWFMRRWGVSWRWRRWCGRRRGRQGPCWHFPSPCQNWSNLGKWSGFSCCIFCNSCCHGPCCIQPYQSDTGSGAFHWASHCLLQTPRFYNYLMNKIKKIFILFSIVNKI